MEPTVFTDVEDHMYLAKEESFGPIMVISKFQNGYVPRHNLTGLARYRFFFSLPLCYIQSIQLKNIQFLLLLLSHFSRVRLCATP